MLTYDWPEWETDMLRRFWAYLERNKHNHVMAADIAARYGMGLIKDFEDLADEVKHELISRELIERFQDASLPD